MKVKVSRAGRGDLDKLVELNLALNDFHRKWHLHFKPAGVVRRKSKKYLAKQMHSRKALVLKAETENEIVGFAMAELKKKPPVCTKRNYAHLDSIFVSAPHRKKGIARLLARKVEEWAKKKGVNKIELKAFSPNTSAIKTYGKLGFREEAKMMTKTLRPKK